MRARKPGLQSTDVMVSFSHHGMTLSRPTSATATCGTDIPVTISIAGRSVFTVTVWLFSGLIFGLILGSGSAAWAQDVTCTCRYQGEKYGVGESICLKSPSGLRMATCEMVLNNTSWQISNAPCPLTQIQSPAIDKFTTRRPTTPTYSSG